MDNNLVEEILVAAKTLKESNGGVIHHISNVGMRMPGLNATHRETTKVLARELFLRLHGKDIGPNAPVEERKNIYINYTKLRSALKKAYVEHATVRNLAEKKPKSCKLTPFHQARYSSELYQRAKDLPLSEQVLLPTAMPVDVSKYDELKDFFERLRMPTNAEATRFDDIGAYEEFKRGAYYVDGRIDLCKQVVGPDHIQSLMQSIRMNPNIIHFLLGNNIIGSIGAKAIADFIADPTKLSNIQTWYIAGNNINSEGTALIATSLANDTHCKDLWLKRNPVGVNGAKALAKMLETNKSIETIDLDNTAILDDGCIAIFESLAHNTTLKSVYLDANALTVKSALAIAKYFYHKQTTNKPGITHLSLSMNRMEDDGAIHISDALLHSRYPLQCLVLSSNRIELHGLKHILTYAATSTTLKVLDVGYYKATADMGELPNSFGNTGARYLAAFIMLNTPLRYLGFHNTHITDMSQIKAAIECNTNLYMVSPEQFLVSCANLYEYCRRNSGLSIEEHKKLARRLRHGDNIWVIDSIYRNNM